VLKRKFGPKSEEMAGGWRSFITCTFHHISWGWPRKGWGGGGM